MSTQKTTTFLVPEFTKSIPGKVKDAVEVKGPQILATGTAPAEWSSAIATAGFPSNASGTFVYALKIDEIRRGFLCVGFTDMKTFDQKKGYFPGFGMTGAALALQGGSVYPMLKDQEERFLNYLPPLATRVAKELVAVLSVNAGTKKEILMQLVVDGNEGRVIDFTENFPSGGDIFPCICFADENQLVRTIAFDQVGAQSRASPVVSALLKEFSATNIRATPPASTSSGAAVASNNNNNDNDDRQLIDQLLQEQQAAKQRAKDLEGELQQKDAVIQQQAAEIQRLRQLANKTE